MLILRCQYRYIIILHLNVLYTYLNEKFHKLLLSILIQILMNLLLFIFFTFIQVVNKMNIIYDC